jgi:hypothetical protein
MSAPSTIAPEQTQRVRTPIARCTRTYIAFVEILQEWAECPADGPDVPYWGAAMAHEMGVGMWSGCHVRILYPENALYSVILETRASASLWRDRTSELAARARDLRKAASREYRVRAIGTQPRFKPLDRDDL